MKFDTEVFCHPQFVKFNRGNDIRRAKNFIYWEKKIGKIWKMKKKLRENKTLTKLVNSGKNSLITMALTQVAETPPLGNVGFKLPVEKTIKVADHY